MIGRRSAALLCVLLTHVLLFLLFRLHPTDESSRDATEDFVSAPITMFLPSPEPTPETSSEQPPRLPARAPAALPRPALRGETAAESNAISTPSARVDWPLEGKKAAERVLAREAEAERIARMFAGPERHLGIAHQAAALEAQQVPLQAGHRRPGVRREGQPDLSHQRRLRDRQLRFHRLRARQGQGARRHVREHARVLRRASACRRPTTATAPSRRRCGRRTNYAQPALLRNALPPL